MLLKTATKPARRAAGDRELSEASAASGSCAAMPPAIAASA